MKTVLASLSLGAVALFASAGAAHAAGEWKPGVVIYAVELKEKVKIKEEVVIEELRPAQKAAGSVANPGEGWAHGGGSVVNPVHGGGSVVQPVHCNGSVVHPANGGSVVHPANGSVVRPVCRRR